MVHLPTGNVSLRVAIIERLKPGRSKGPLISIETRLSTTLILSHMGLPQITRIMLNNLLDPKCGLCLLMDMLVVTRISDILCDREEIECVDAIATKEQPVPPR